MGPTSAGSLLRRLGPARAGEPGQEGKAGDEALMPVGGRASGKTHLPCNGKYVLFHKKVARNGFFGMFA